MKKTFFKRLFNAKASIAFTMLLGGILLFYACVDDENLDPNTTESIEIVDENSMKLIVDGKFVKTIDDINSFDDTLYRYIVVNRNEIEAYTTEVSFKNFDDYTRVMSNINNFRSKAINHVNEPTIPQDVAEKAFIDLLLKDRNNVVSKSTNVNDLSFIFDYNWPNHTGGLVAHFNGIVFDYNSFEYVNYHNITKLKSDLRASNQITHSHLQGYNYIRPINNHNISGMISNSTTTVRNTDDSLSELYLSTGTFLSGRTYLYRIQTNDDVVLPTGRYYQSIYIRNF